MKLKDYAKLIADMASKYPNFDVVYSSDDEGNRFDLVQYNPSVGKFDGEWQFTAMSDDGKQLPKNKCNAVCIN